MNSLLQLKNPAWDVIDSTKIQTLLQCERLYMWEHLAGWRGRASNHLAYGTAIHEGLAYLYESGQWDELGVLEAFTRFERAYRAEGFSAETDEAYWPKTPDRAAAFFVAYINYWRGDLERYKVLHTEVSGKVPLGDSRELYFRWDCVLEDRLTGLVFILEHKTGSSDYAWDIQWPLKFQVGAYTHALCSWMSPERVKGVEINGLIFTRAKGTRGGELFKFMRTPVYRSTEQMEQWLWTAHDILDRMDFEMERLHECKDDDPLLYAYPMRTESCSSFGGCRYHDYCCNFQNPLALIARGVPPEFDQKWWDPRERKAQLIINL